MAEFFVLPSLYVYKVFLILHKVKIIQRISLEYLKKIQFLNDLYNSFVRNI